MRASPLVRSLASALVISLLLLVSALYGCQRQILFPAPADSFPNTLASDIEFIALETGGAFLAPPLRTLESAAPLIVFAHGNAELAHWSIDSFRFFRERGFAILLLEYPGYGGMPGSASSNAIEQSALLALDAVLDRPEIDETRIVAYGRSVGSGAACLIAAQRGVSALVLESAFTSLHGLVAAKGLPAQLLRDHFDNLAIIRELDVPVFLYHGTRDRIVPFEHSEALAAVAKRATLVSAECGHNDCRRPWPAIFAFLEDADLVATGAPKASRTRERAGGAGDPLVR